MSSSAMDFRRTSVKGFAHAPAEVARDVRFLQYGKPLLLRFLEQSDVGTITRGENDRNIRL